MRERSFNQERFNASLDLPDLINSLLEIPVYVTRSERNYVCYSLVHLGEEG